MRIAILQPERKYSYGGAHRVLDGLLPLLSAKDAVAFFGFSFQLRSDYDKIEKHLINWQKAPSALSRFSLLSERKSLLELMKEVNKWEPDVLILNNRADLASWVSSKSLAPTVFYAHDIVYNFRWLTEARQRSLGKLYRNVIGIQSDNLGKTRLVLCVCQYVESAYKREFPKLDTRVIYSGVNHNWFRPSWNDKGFGLCVSRLRKNKNLQLLSQAFRNSSYPVVLIGDANARGADSVDELIAGSGIKFKQFVSDAQLLEDLQSCSFFVNPGKAEGLSMATLEAMACGKPVLCHNSGGTPELVGSAGYLLGDDPKDWRSAADQLMESASKRMELGTKAYERSLNFSWDKTAAEIEKSLLGLINGNQSDLPS